MAINCNDVLGKASAISDWFASNGSTIRRTAEIIANTVSSTGDVAKAKSQLTQAQAGLRQMYAKESELYTLEQQAAEGNCTTALNYIGDTKRYAADYIKATDAGIIRGQTRISDFEKQSSAVICDDLSEQASEESKRANKVKNNVATLQTQLASASGSTLANIITLLDAEKRTLDNISNVISGIGANAQTENCENVKKQVATITSTVNSLESQINTLKTEATNKQQATPAAGASGATGPAAITGASGATGAAIAGGSGATGPTPIDPNSPALGNAGPVEVTEPKINVGEDTSSDPGNTNNGLPGDIDDAQAEASYQDTVNFQKKEDWRVRLSLSPGADYLYKVPNGQAGILNPLQETDGVIFPYTPTINVNYTASYDATNLTHSNYKIYQYQSSSVDSISIACDFTAQDTYEANYLLAVIHFFRSLTKMFYGQDENPKPGTPPPLVYLFGLGAFQFEAHPLVITNFSYNLPADVDYIRATNSFQNAGINQSPGTSRGDTSDPSQQRLTSGPNANIAPGGKAAPANFPPSRDGTNDPTYVPTKINISLSAYPIVSRYDISRNFSVKKYATGELLRGTTRSGGGIW